VGLSAVTEVVSDDRLQAASGMRKRHLLWATALAWAAAPALASQHIVDIAWDPGARFEHSAVVPGGKFLEVCGKLDVGTAVRWSFKAAAPLDFNIHYHVGKSAEFPAKRAQVAAAEDVLRVNVKEDYCWMWTNKSDAPTRVELRLQR
jgi:hypothetical protein